MAQRIAFAAAALCLIALGLDQLRPPACPAEVGPSDFSCERAMAHVRAIASAPHPAGSQANAAAREYLLSQMEMLGLSPRVVTTRTVAFGRLFTLHNLMGRLPGTSSGPALVLCCHYDSAIFAPGAGDDGAAVGALLEAFRAVKSGPALRTDLVLLITDGEELGLRGAWGLMEQARDELPEVGLVLNFDARGTSGPCILYETSDGNQTLVREFASAAPDPFGTSLGYDVKKRMPNDSDFTVFRRAGMRGLNFAFIDNYVFYHTANDSIANLDPRTVYHTGSYALSLARRFGNEDLGALRDRDEGDAVFFNPFRGVMIVYGSRWIWPITALVFALVAVSLARGIYLKRLRVTGILIGLSGIVVSAALAAAADWGLWKLSRVALGRGWLESSAGFILRPSPTPNAIRGLTLVFSLIALLVALYVIQLLRRLTASENLAAAGAIVWALAALGTSIWLPGGSYLASGPLLFAIAGFLVTCGKGTEPTWRRAAIVSAASAPTLLMLPPSIALFFTALTVQNAFIVAPLIALSVWLLVTSGGVGFLLPAFQIKAGARIG